jgi:hypothetical protein
VKHYGTILTPITKMHLDFRKSNIVNEDLSLLCDLELILGIHAILLFLDFMHAFVKLA